MKNSQDNSKQDDIKTELQKSKLHESAKELVIRKNSEEHLQYEEETVFFISFDLVNSTLFKSIEADRWIAKITQFYEMCDSNLSLICDDACLWKRQGDEVLYYFHLKDIQELYDIFPKMFDALDRVISEMEENEGKGILSVKATFWVALISKDKSCNDVHNIPIPLEGNYDFVGADIDFGFRISKYATAGVICVDPKIVAVLSERYNLTNFRIVQYTQLKGIWDNRFVPIVWYHEKIKDPVDIFAYDEQEKNPIVKELLTNKNDGKFMRISKITKVFKDTNRQKYIERLKRSIGAHRIVMGRTPSSNRITEFHVIAILFDENNCIFCAKRSKEKKIFPGLWENGCTQLRTSTITIEETVKKNYKDKFGIDIIKIQMDTELGYSVPKPLGLFSFTDAQGSLIPGMIVIGQAKRPESEIYDKNSHSEVKWMTLQEVQELPDESVVEGFKCRIKLADNVYKTNLISGL